MKQSHPTFKAESRKNAKFNVAYEMCTEVCLTELMKHFTHETWTCRCVRTEELLRALELLWLDEDGRCATNDMEEFNCQLMLNGIISLASVMIMMMMKMKM